MGRFFVMKAGLMTTVQDLGRYGYQALGITTSGAMDAYSLMTANRLVGNRSASAGLEFTGMGPTIRFEDPALFALAGADFSAELNHKPIHRYVSMEARPGDILTLRHAEDGFRGYLAIAGGIAVQPVLGSRSTDLTSGFGGKRLKNGDEMYFNDSGDRTYRKATELCESYPAGCIHEIRVIMGPDTRKFTQMGVETFLTSEFKIAGDSNRMGYRLEGRAIEHGTTADITSGAVTFGTIQVPGSGQPIMMMAEHQTTGGYARIAHVISRDLAKAAQLKPGDSIRFKAISVEDATALDHQHRQLIETLTSRIFRSFLVTLNGKSYQVEVEDCDYKG